MRVIFAECVHLFLRLFKVKALIIIYIKCAKTWTKLDICKIMLLNNSIVKFCKLDMGVSRIQDMVVSRISKKWCWFSGGCKKFVQVCPSVFLINLLVINKLQTFWTVWTWTNENGFFGEGVKS